jgi:hypothetical protein
MHNLKNTPFSKVVQRTEISQTASFMGSLSEAHYICGWQWPLPSLWLPLSVTAPLYGCPFLCGRPSLVLPLSFDYLLPESALLFERVFRLTPEAVRLERKILNAGR